MAADGEGDPNAIQDAGWNAAAAVLWQVLRVEAPYRAEIDFKARLAQEFALFDLCKAAVAGDDVLDYSKLKT